MYIKFLFFFSLLVLSVGFSFAGTSTLTKIGSLDINGNRYSEWWYTEINPTFYGVSGANSDVTIKIDDKSNTAKADTSGNWSYYAALQKGDYKISIVAGTDSYAFTLHLGQALPDNVSKQSTAASTGTPTTGFNQFLGITLGFGVVLLASYLYFSIDCKKKTIFENRMLKE